MNPIVKQGKEEEVGKLILARKTTYMIAKETGFTRGAVESFKKKMLKPAESLQNDRFKTTLAVEITQQHTLTELSTQLASFAEEYENAKFTEDKQRWGALYHRCLETVIKVVGLDKGLPQATSPEKNTIVMKWMSSADVEEIKENSRFAREQNVENTTIAEVLK